MIDPRKLKKQNPELWKRKERKERERKGQTALEGNHGKGNTKK